MKTFWTLLNFEVQLDSIQQNKCKLELHKLMLNSSCLNCNQFVTIINYEIFKKTSQADSYNASLILFQSFPQIPFSCSSLISMIIRRHNAISQVKYRCYLRHYLPPLPTMYCIVRRQGSTTGENSTQRTVSCLHPQSCNEG